MLETIAKECIKKRLWLASAESATGGLIGDSITNLPGSSLFFKGGIIAYNNEVKINLLEVKTKTLDDFGAVSAETAKEMAMGAQKKLNADIAVATTGIAGPAGGTKEKPVGLVYICLAAKEDAIVSRFLFTGDRHSNKKQFCDAALKMILDYLLK